MSKRIIIWITVANILASTHAVGQQPTAAEDQAAMREDLMQRIEESSEELALTDQQREQVKAILVESGERSQAVFEQHGFSKENPPQTRRDKRKLMRDLRPIRKWREDELSKVLSPEQMKLIEEWQEQAREEFKARR
jgi:Spy/CpxP family protein refolding chaperone